MKITLDINKTVEENARLYFEKAKKARKKSKGAVLTVEKTKKKLKKIKKEAAKEIKEEKITRKKEWYENFRWFFSSDEFLVIGGRDATSNEIVVKKYTEKNDIVFHTEMAGSPFVVIKAKNKKVPESTIEETAEFCASYSRAWKLGITAMEVFYVSPEQVTKKAKSGEYIAKGAFMIYGKKNYVHAELGLTIGIKNNAVMAGPEKAVKKHCKKYVRVRQGKGKTSAVAKKIQKKIGGDLDDIIRVLPAGGCEII